MAVASNRGPSGTTTMLCAKCGGAVSPPRDFHGRTCTCVRGADADASNVTGVGHKYCCACGADVTHAKRMKDHQGRYWCYECGAADQLKKGQALRLRCPDCLRSFPPAQMVGVGTENVCPGCLAKRQSRKGWGRAGKATGGKSAGGSGFVAGLAVVLLLAGAVLLAMYFMDVL